jgi:hypothetical protein
MFDWKTRECVQEVLALILAVGMLLVMVTVIFA